MQAEQWILLVFPEEQGKLQREHVIDFVNTYFNNYALKYPMGLYIWFEDNQWHVKLDRKMINL